jgi:hypothetical protein
MDRQEDSSEPQQGLLFRKKSPAREVEPSALRIDIGGGWRSTRKVT